MPYIKVVDNVVTLAGEVATDEMINDGYFYYDKEIPRGSKLIYQDNKVIAVLDKEKEDKIKELYEEYNKANEEDVDYMDTKFQADKKSQELIAQVLSVGTAPEGFYWVDSFNNKVPMTYEQLQGLGATILHRNQLNFDKLQTLKEQVKNASTYEEIESIKWKEEE